MSVIHFLKQPQVLSFAAVGGKIESEGPLGAIFDEIFNDGTDNDQTWEQEETQLQVRALRHALQKTTYTPNDIQLHFGGDLLNQCCSTNFALRQLGIPLAGLYGACSTFALSLALGALALESGLLQRVSTCVSSHFCSAEKQFRFPLEYGGQPTSTAQRTVTAAGAVLLGCPKTAQNAPDFTENPWNITKNAPEKNQTHTKITQTHTQDFAYQVELSSALFGRVLDYGVLDANAMGAAMAPAAFDTLQRFLRETGTRPCDYDMILTGDLGTIGRDLLLDLAQREAGLALEEQLHDCGLHIYDKTRQDVGVGGSGAGCSAAVVCGEILPKLRRGDLKTVLFLGTGALLSCASPLQGETIPAIAHAVLLQAHRS